MPAGENCDTCKRFEICRSSGCCTGSLPNGYVFLSRELRLFIHIVTEQGRDCRESGTLVGYYKDLWMEEILPMEGMQGNAYVREPGIWREFRHQCCLPTYRLKHLLQRLRPVEGRIGDQGSLVGKDILR